MIVEAPAAAWIEESRRAFDLTGDRSAAVGRVAIRCKLRDSAQSWGRRLHPRRRSLQFAALGMESGAASQRAITAISDATTWALTLLCSLDEAQTFAARAAQIIHTKWWNDVAFGVRSGQRASSALRNATQAVGCCNILSRAGLVLGCSAPVSHSAFRIG